MASQPSTAASKAPRAATLEPAARESRPAACCCATSAGPPQSPSAVAMRCGPALRLVRALGREVGPDAGHDERDQQASLPAAVAASRASRQSSMATAGSPATSAVSARPHSGGEHQRDLAALAADGQRSPSRRPRAVHVAAAEGDEAERVARAQRCRAGCRARRAPSRRSLTASSQSPLVQAIMRRRRRHQPAAVRLLDLVGVAEALAEAAPGAVVVHQPDGHRSTRCGRP